MRRGGGLCCLVEVRGQKSEVRSQRSEVRGQKSEVRSEGGGAAPQRCAGACQGVSSSLNRGAKIMKIAVLEREGRAGEMREGPRCCARAPHASATVDV